MWIVATKKPVHQLDDMHEDHEWLCRQNLGPYKGEWVAVAERCIIAHDRDFDALMTKLTKLARPLKPLLVQIPDLPLAA